MSIGYTRDITKQFKDNIYHIEIDVTGWDTVNLQFVAPVSGIHTIYGSLNDGMSQGQLYTSDNYAASRALDFSTVQGVDLATGTATTTVSAAGIYSVPVNFPYLQIKGGGDVYALYQHNIKIG